ncbi:MAG: hypothetical protein HY462_01705, partial [Parcubacteria group bacterium]|nr:hypothetical protein [Parcubacteria group bacterium]
MRLSRSRTFLLTLLAFVAGVGAASFALPSVLFMYASALAFVVALVMAWQRRTFRIAGLAGLFFVLGMGRMAFAIPNLE